MKKLIFSALGLILLVLVFTSCEQTYTDLMTASVKTGGLLTPSSAVPYKLGGTPSFTITVTIPKGPGIVSIDVYKSYTGIAEVFDQNVNVGSANTTADASVSITYTYATLTSGLNMPANETVLKIGDAWTLRYESVMEDGRKVRVGPKTTITVANKYAGFYQCVGVFHHPTAGDRPINEKKFLTPIDASSCWGPAGDLGSSGYLVRFTVNPVTNAVTCSKWDNYDFANQAGNPSFFNPADGTFHVNYFYVGSGGNRVINEVWTPIP